MGVGHVAIGAPGRHHFVGYTRTRRVEALARLVPLRMVVGLHADDQSVPGFAPPFPARMGGVPSVSSEPTASRNGIRSEEHTSELQSRLHLVCRLLLEKKNNKPPRMRHSAVTRPP